MIFNATLLYIEGYLAITYEKLEDKRWRDVYIEPLCYTNTTNHELDSEILKLIELDKLGGVIEGLPILKIKPRQNISGNHENVHYSHYTRILLPLRVNHKNES